MTEVLNWQCPMELDTFCERTPLLQDIWVKLGLQEMCGDDVCSVSIPRLL